MFGHMRKLGLDWIGLIGLSSIEDSSCTDLFIRKTGKKQKEKEFK